MVNHRLSQTGKRWLLASTEAHTEDLILDLARERGISPGEPAHLNMLQSPNVFGDLRKIGERIERAAKQKEAVMVFGDYDCDGITATMQMTRFLERRGIEPVIRLPHRVKDGYGLTQAVADEILSGKIDLVITVDTGIASAKEIAYLQSSGTDVIVTDHHAVPDAVPSAFAIVHPEHACEYERPHPSGAGVVFQLIRGLEDGKWPDMETDLALAMIGTVADVMELRGDNRTLVRMGLAAIATSTDPALRTLCESAKIRPQDISSTDVGFRIAPRINAAGRMDDPTIALHALRGDMNAIESLNVLNDSRKEETQHCLSLAMKDIESQLAESSYLLRSADEEYGHGIVGLIAGRLTEQFGMPSMIATVDGEECTASLRSPPGVNITAALTENASLLVRFGGHAQAAGCTFLTQNFTRLSEALNQSIAKQVRREDLCPTVHIDREIRTSDITLRLCNDLALLEPYGHGNTEPVFLLKNVAVSQAQRMGNDGAHMRCIVDGIKAVGFNMGHLAQDSSNTDIACTLSVDTWMNNLRPQITIKDIRSGQ